MDASLPAQCLKKLTNGVSRWKKPAAYCITCVRSNTHRSLLKLRVLRPSNIVNIRMSIRAGRQGFLVLKRLSSVITFEHPRKLLCHPIFYRYFDKYIVLVLDNGICICYHKDMVPIPYNYTVEGASI